MLFTWETTMDQRESLCYFCWSLGVVPVITYYGSCIHIFTA